MSDRAVVATTDAPPPIVNGAAGEQMAAGLCEAATAAHASQWTMEQFIRAAEFCYGAMRPPEGDHEPES